MPGSTLGAVELTSVLFGLLIGAVLGAGVAWLVASARYRAETAEAARAVDRADPSRVLILRTASDYTAPPPGLTAADLLKIDEGGGSSSYNFSAYTESLTAAYLVASPVVRYLAAQGARQCGPCANGLPALAGAVEALLAGTDTTERVFELAGLVAGRGACTHPDGAARFAASALHVAPEEVDVHVDAFLHG